MLLWVLSWASALLQRFQVLLCPLDLEVTFVWAVWLAPLASCLSCRQETEAMSGVAYRWRLLVTHILGFLRFSGLQSPVIHS